MKSCDIFCVKKYKNLLRIILIGIVMVSLFIACPKQEEIPKSISSWTSLLKVPANREIIKEGEYENKGYESVEFGQDSKLLLISKDAFKGNSIKSLGLGLVEGITKIGASAFEGNPIEKLDLPDSLTTVEKNAFKGNNLIEVVLPNGITSIGEDAFIRADEALPVLRVPDEKVMQLVFSRFTMVKGGSKVLPVVKPVAVDETIDIQKLEQAITTHEQQVEDDSEAPTVYNVSITSNPKDTTNNIYKDDEDIKVSVQFSEEVYVFGEPQMTLQIGNKERKAVYDSDDSSDTELTFVYTVVVDDYDNDGIAITSLDLKGGAIKDQAGHNADMSSIVFPDGSQHKVNSDTLRVTSIKITSSPRDEYAYKENEIIEITVTFNRKAKLGDTNKNLPYICYRSIFRGRTIWCIKVVYEKGDDTKEFIFTYKLKKGDYNKSNYIDYIKLNGNTIKDVNGKDAILTYSYPKSTGRSFKTNAPIDKGPKITGISAQRALVNDAGIYKQGKKIIVTVTFDISVKVDAISKPELRLRLHRDGSKGIDIVKATFSKKASSGKALEFEHTVKGEGSVSGYGYISILNNDLLLPSSTSITDQEGASAFTTMTPKKISGTTGKSRDLSKQELQTSAGEHRPKIEGVKIVSTTKNGYYKLGDEIKVRVTFNRKISLKGRGSEASQSKIKMLIDTLDGKGKEVQLEYSSQPSDRSLDFRYVIQNNGDDAGFYDTDGIRIKAGRIEIQKDFSVIDTENGSEAELNHMGVDSGSPMDKHKVDAISPELKSVSFSTTYRGADVTYKSNISFITDLPILLSSPYKTGNMINIKAIFSEQVKMHENESTTDTSICGGRPYLKLKIGGKRKQACVRDVRDNKGFSKQHWFTYAVQPGDNDAKGVVLNVLRFFRNELIKDSAGNTALDRWYGVRDKELNKLKTHSRFRRVDTKPPEIFQVTYNDKKSYKTGDNIYIKVHFTEPVLIKTSGDRYVEKIEPNMVKLILNIGGDGVVDFPFYKTLITISGEKHKNKTIMGGRRLMFQTISFRYKVTKDSTNGKITIPSNILKLADGFIIVDTAGNNVVTHSDSGNTIIQLGRNKKGYSESPGKISN